MTVDRKTAENERLMLIEDLTRTRVGRRDKIRKAIINADLVGGVVAMTGYLFYSTQIPVWLWFVAKNNYDDKQREPFAPAIVA